VQGSCLVVGAICLRSCRIRIKLELSWILELTVRLSQATLRDAVWPGGDRSSGSWMLRDCLHGKRMHLSWELSEVPEISGVLSRL